MENTQYDNDNQEKIVSHKESIHSTKSNKEEVPQYSHDEKLKACLQILRKFQITKYKKVIDALTTIVYEDDDLLNDFLQKIDQPSEISKEDKNGDFLICEYNREGDSYRSCISNTYYPATDDDVTSPSEEIREMEIIFNKLFSEYTRLYYGGAAICSCYCWQLGEKVEDGISVAVIIKNQVDSSKGVRGGSWDSSHLVVISFENKDDKIQVNYKLTSTVFFAADLKKGLSLINLNGCITRLVRKNDFFSLKAQKQQVNY